MGSCDRCYRRKCRCDMLQPTCSNCQKARTGCVYTDRTRAPTQNKEHIQSLERRLRQAEAKNEALSGELARSRTARQLSVRPQVSPDISTNAQSPETMNAGSMESQQRSVQPVGSENMSSSVSAPAPAPANDLMNEVSFLASNAAGERQYLGSTSGVLFANLVRASVNMADTFGKSFSTNIRVSDGEVHNNHLPHNRQDGIEALPQEDLAVRLVDSYLAHDHIAYPFLLPSFIKTITKSIYSDPTFYMAHGFEAFVFDMVLAIANANVYKYDWQMLPSAEGHHTRAMSRIGEVFQAGGLKSLQAILLLCQYRTGSSIQDTSASMWHLVGIAVRTAYELGLHRESAYPIKSIEGSSPEALENQEVRRRCFWCVFSMDRVVSITLGRPLAINIDDIDLELPTAVFASPALSDVENDNKRTSIFVHIVRYRLLCGKIMRALHGPKRRGPDQLESAIYRSRDDLAMKLEEWWRETENLALVESHGLSPAPQQNSSFKSKEWYEILYQNAMLMLFRPSPMLSDISKEPATLQKIFNSSKKAVLLYASLHRSRKINYSWITLHSVFMAGLSYIYAVSCHFREQRKQSRTGAMLESSPTTIEIVNDTRACSNVLVAVSERWNALRHCHEVFDRLSDAVLVDAIKLGSNPQTQQEPPYSVSSQSRLQADAVSGYIPPSHQNNPWYQNEPTLMPDQYTQASPLAVDSEFRNCFGDLQHLYHQQYNDDPVIQLSQDWLGYLDGYDGFLPVLSDQTQDQGMGIS